MNLLLELRDIVCVIKLAWTSYQFQSLLTWSGSEITSWRKRARERDTHSFFGCILSGSHIRCNRTFNSCLVSGREARVTSLPSLGKSMPISFSSTTCPSIVIPVKQFYVCIYMKLKAHTWTHSHARCPFLGPHLCDPII